MIEAAVWLVSALIVCGAVLLAACLVLGAIGGLIGVFMELFPDDSMLPPHPSDPLDERLRRKE